ncbi:MAG: hypothetical protein ACXWT1_04055 [Methylobacter sp.]
MKDYFTEILIVIAYSGRTQAAIIMGMIGFIVISLLGDYYLANFELSGTVSAFTDVIKENYFADTTKQLGVCYSVFGGWPSCFTIKIKRSSGTAFSCSMTRLRLI